jgi:hypothetical protein
MPRRNTLLSVDVPPTPISPIVMPNTFYPFFESPTLSLARAAGLTQLRKPQVALNTEDIFSPPATPAKAHSIQRAYSYTGETSEFYLSSYEGLSPSRESIPENAIPSEYGQATEDIILMSDESSDGWEAQMDFSEFIEL